MKFFGSKNLKGGPVVPKNSYL